MVALLFLQGGFRTGLTLLRSAYGLEILWKPHGRRKNLTMWRGIVRVQEKWGCNYKHLLISHLRFSRTGSTHVREKDGIWTSLLWLSLLSAQGTDVETVLRSHWVQFGRNYYGRHDYEGVDTEKANEVMRVIGDQIQDKKRLEDISGKPVATADNFSYKDPVDGSVASNQGLRIIFSDGSRIVWRLSGTGSQGATVRLYLESFSKDALSLESATALKDIHAIALKLSNMHSILGVNGPTVIT